MRAELEDWYRFIRSQSHVLHRPQRLFQLAVNEPDSSQIAKSAAERLRTRRETRPWLRWINKPQERNPCLVTLTGGGRKSGFAFSPDSSRIVTGWNDESMEVWNAHTGQSLLRLPCLTTPKYERDLTVMGCAFVAGGKRIITYVEDDSLKLWDAETGEEVAWLSCHGDGAKAWCASPDGRRVAAWFWDNNVIKIWDTATGELFRTIHSTAEPLFGPMTYSADDLFLAKGSTTGTVEIWTSEYGVPFSTLSVGFLENLEFSPDEMCVLTTDNVFHAAHLWGAFNPMLLASFKGHTDRITAAHCSPDGKRVATASWDKTLKLWSVKGDDLMTLKGHTGHVTDCAFSPDGTLLVSASEDRTLKLWDCETGNVLATFVGHAQPVAACAFSPDGKLIVSTSNDSTRIWDAFARIGSGQRLDRISTCSFSSDGTKAVVDESVVFDVALGKRLEPSDNRSFSSLQLKTHSYVELSEWEPTPTQIRFSADGEYLIGVVDQRLKVLNANQAEVRIIYDKAPATFCVSPDGRKVVCAILEDFFDQSIKCFETLTGTERFTVRMGRPYGDRTQFRFTFNSHIVVMLTPAGTLLLVDADSGEIISEFLHHENIVTFDTSPIENVVIAGGQLGSVYILLLENAVDKRP